MIGISKATWVKKFLDLCENDPVIECLGRLGEMVIPRQLTDGCLPDILKPLEKFICLGYAHSNTTVLEIPAVRWQLFHTKNLESENLPPTRAAFLQHILRVNFVCKRDKSYTEYSPQLPVITENGWTSISGTLFPVMCEELPAPKAVLELTKCGCTTGCIRRSCGCLKNTLPCTPLCKCEDCENQTRLPSVRDVNDDEDEQN